MFKASAFGETENREQWYGDRELCTGISLLSFHEPAGHFRDLFKRRASHP